MARVNIGVNPKFLADQHLIAESVEIIMITGGLRKNNFQIRSEIPKKFNLGRGHINFFKNKLLYLKRRLEVVNQEMINRGFNPGTNLDLNAFPNHLINDWKPQATDSQIIRERICSRLLTRANGQSAKGYYRYKRKYIENELEFAEKLKNSDLYEI